MPINEMMQAMILKKPGEPLQMKELPVPIPGSEEVLIRVRACGICRTDLHIVDGELPRIKLPLIPGHEIIGTVVKKGALAEGFHVGQRIGVPWLGYSDGKCSFCKKGKENLCDNAKFTGYTLDGGYADYVIANHRYCFSVPSSYSDAEAAPLMCAGLIGYRSYWLATEEPGVERLGIYGFGAAAHIICQVAVFQGKEVYAFTRPGDTKAQEFALRLGAAWSGGSNQQPPHPLDAAIIFAPVGSLIPGALRVTAKGGCVVCGGIHMSDIPSFPYRILWEERIVRSVANLTRQDGREFLEIAPKVPVRTDVQTYCLEDANRALDDLRHGRITGAAVLVMNR
ncbi:MAG: zinc-dependent alcohol dehydrogenase family protein [Methanotrichaceae archaeon]|nr:zinc-dependent alcohol dehydrogenase family protein [Methanotrichaceae archaeon]